jgi:Domain of unknown function (DUF4352)/Histidine phosphatase superfamily (branch 1)
VPTLTAAAVALLTSDKVAQGAVLAVGILGFFAVFAIAMYDLRNSQIYDATIARAKYLEKELHLPSFTGRRYGGLYSERPGHTLSLFEILVWHDRALALIYGTALGGWFWIITYSLLSFFSWPRFVVDLASIPIPALVAWAFISQFHQIEAIRSRSRTLTVHSVDTIKNHKSDNSYQFVSVNVSLTNRRKHPLNYNVLELKLRDNQDYPYKSEQQNLTGTLKTGEQTGLVPVYQIPEKHKPAKLVYTPHPRFLKVQQIIDLTEYITIDEYFTMDIVLVRHGDRDKINYTPKDEKDSPLTQVGKDKVDHLKDLLACLNLNPEIYLASKHKHALETAERLSYGRSKPVVIDAFTPGKTSYNEFENNFWEDQKRVELSQQKKISAIRTLFDDVKQERVELSQQTTVVIVGHEWQLDDIFTCLTLQSVHLFNNAPNYFLDYAGAVWVRADSFDDFLQGKGVVKAWISGDKGSGVNIGGRGLAAKQTETFSGGK